MEALRWLLHEGVARGSRHVHPEFALWRAGALRRAAVRARLVRRGAAARGGGVEPQEPSRARCFRAASCCIPPRSSTCGCGRSTRIVFASGYGWLVVGSFFWRDRTIGGADRRASARMRPLGVAAGAVDSGRDDRRIAGVRVRLLGFALRVPPHSGAVGVPQGAPFGGGDDDLHRDAAAPGRDHLLHERDRRCTTGLAFGLMTYLSVPASAT